MLVEMIKKISILGSSAVGKTSLTNRFVHRFFPDSFLSTIGVNIQNKALTFEDQNYHLDIWDIQGENYFDELMKNYFRGSSAYILAIDGSDPKSFEAAIEIHKGCEKDFEDVPCVTFINKCDQKDFWTINPTDMTYLNLKSLNVFETSAKTGEGVDEGFNFLLNYLFLGQDA